MDVQSSSAIKSKNKSQKQFVKTLGKVLHRPTYFPTPSFMIKLAFGQMGKELLLQGQHVVPYLLQHYDFNFRYPDLTSALTAIYGSTATDQEVA